MGTEKIKFKEVNTAIIFFMLVNQFRRVTGKIEELHDKRSSKDCDKDETTKSINYYQSEKARLLSMMKDALDKTEEYTETAPF